VQHTEHWLNLETDWYITKYYGIILYLNLNKLSITGIFVKDL